MAKEWAKAFYNSNAWLRCRSGFIQSVYGLCARCQETGYIVHHKTLLTPSNINDPYVALNWECLEYLCLDCHNKEHMSNHDVVIRDGLMFNSKGEIVQAPLKNIPL